MHCILAVDIGTTSAKGLLIESNGKVIWSHQIQYATRYPQPGYAEQDPLQIWEAVRKIMATGYAAHPQALAGICFSCAMHGIMAVDNQGQPLTPLLIWSDTRATPQAEWLKAQPLAASIYHATGTPIHPMSPLCKLLWWKQNQPELTNQAARFVSVKEYILFQLSGEWVIDYSLASATGLFDNQNLQWMDAALEVAGVHRAQLSLPVSPYQIIQLSQTACLNLLAIPTALNLIVGASDGCLANLGSEVLSPQHVSITLGTSGAVRTTVERFCEDEKQRIFNYILDEKRFVAGGATNNGSILLSWFINLFPAKQSLAERVAAAMSIGAGENDLLFLPYVFGERAPFYSPFARGAFIGLAQHHSQSNMLRAVMEGVCFEIKTIFEALQEAVPLADSPSIVASGGFIQSREWVQLLAEILGHQVSIASSSDASALGAAKMGFAALHIPHHFTNSIAEMYSPQHPGSYEGGYKMFKQLTSQMLPHFHALSGEGKIKQTLI